MKFEARRNTGRLTDDLIENKRDSIDQHSVIVAQCFPLASILLALKQTTVDYFSLDVEGAELAVLKAIPWDKVDIKILSVEVAHIQVGKDPTKEFMESKGYITYMPVKDIFYEIPLIGTKYANDLIFVKKS